MVQTKESLRNTILRPLNLSEEDLNKIWSGESAGKIQLFKLLDTVISGDYLPNKSPIVHSIFKSHFDFYKNGKRLSIKGIAEMHGYSEYGVTLNVQTQQKDFNRTFAFIRDIQYLDKLHVEQRGLAPWIFIDEKECESINDYSGTDFTQKFISRILGVLINFSHLYIGQDDKSEWRHSYLINKDFGGFNYLGLIEDLRLKMRPYPLRKSEEIWEFATIFEYYAETCNVSFKEGILLMCKGMIDNEFDNVVINDKGIVLPRTSYIPNEEFIQLSLHGLGFDRRGHHKLTIMDYLRDTYPERKWMDSSVASTLISKSEYFASYGKTSTFILKEWVNKKDANIILGDFIDVTKHILENSPTPLSIIDLTEQISFHRNNVDLKSITTILGGARGREVFTTVESFTGLKSSQEHLIFLKTLKSTKGNIATWNNFHTSTTSSVYAYFAFKKYRTQQIDYIIKRKILEGMISVVEDVIYVSGKSNPKAIDILPTIPKSEREIEKSNRTIDYYINRLHALSSTDAFFTSKLRLEHLLLKTILFFGKTKCECAICGREFPVNLLIAAHIKKRAKCTLNERLDHNIVMPACVMGCDALYEKGYISLDWEGTIVSLKENTLHCQPKIYINTLAGRRSSFHKEKNSSYFMEHYQMHTKNKVDIDQKEDDDL
jgi:hypothetical protein